MNKITAHPNIEIVPEYDTKNLDDVLKLVNQVNSELEKTIELVGSLKKAFSELLV